MNDELEEIKERLMIERRMIFEENEKSNFSQGDLNLKLHELRTREEVLNQEARNLQQLSQSKDKEVKLIQKEVNGQVELLKLEKQSLEETKKEYDKKVEDLLNEKKKLEIERVRLWREKANNQQQVKEFIEWKTIVE